MNALLHTNNADAIRRVLIAHVVALSPERRPHLQITTPHETFFLVTVLEPVNVQREDGLCVSIGFDGVDPMGRRRTFMWSEGQVEAPALLIASVTPYRPYRP